MQHRCNLAAKESGLEWTCVNNYDFTVLVSGGSRHRGVSMCTVWPSHSESLEQVEQWICLKLCVKLKHCSAEMTWMVQKATAVGNWWLAAASWQRSCSCTTSCAGFFGKTSNHPGDSAPLQPRFGALGLLAFPQTKTTFEREEISDHWWDSGKYDEAADGNWENCVRSQGAYFEGD